MPARGHFTHLGAVLCDSVLQAGVNYRTVVAKRTRRVIDHFPYASDLPGIRLAVDRFGPEHFLNWIHHEKVGRFLALVDFFEDEEIPTVEGLRHWMQKPDARETLQSVRGVGPKTFDYMACLIGLEQVAIDRHLRTFAKSAGVLQEDYESLRRSFVFAAHLLQLGPKHLDWWVWTFSSERSQRHRQTRSPS